MLDMIFHNCFENLINISVYAYVDIFISLKKIEGLYYTKNSAFYLFLYRQKAGFYLCIYKKPFTIYIHAFKSFRQRSNKQLTHVLLTLILYKLIHIFTDKRDTVI